jgi:hypothetical protein
MLILGGIFTSKLKNSGLVCKFHGNVGGLLQNRRKIRLIRQMGLCHQAVNHQGDQRCCPQEVVAVVVLIPVQRLQSEWVSLKDRRHWRRES